MGFTVDTTSFLDAHRRMNEAFVDHSFILRGDRSQFWFKYQDVELRNLSLHRIGFGAEVQANVPALNDFYTVMLITAGRGATYFSDTNVQMGAGDLIVVNPDLPVRFRLGPGCEQLTLRIERRFVEDSYRAATGHGDAEPILFVPSVSTHAPEVESLALLLRHLWDQAHLRSGLLSQDRSRARAEHLVATALLDLLPHDCSLNWRLAPDVDAPAHLRAAESFILNHLADDLSVPQIARAAPVPVSTLDYMFRKHRGLSTMRFVRQQRLNLARQLLDSDGARSVTDAALQAGFTHFGKFSQAYRQAFGELPSQTLRGRSPIGDLG
jgi:AraC-like DNA-binding protein